MDFRALIYAAPCILLGSLGWAGEPAAIRVAAQSDSEPKFVAQGAAVAGSCIDIFRAIEKVEPGLKFVGDQQWMPLKRIEAMVVGHKLDALAAWCEARSALRLRHSGHASVFRQLPYAGPCR